MSITNSNKSKGNSSSYEGYDNYPINLSTINMVTIYNFNTVYDYSYIFGLIGSSIVPNDENRGRQQIHISKDVSNYVKKINKKNINEKEEENEENQSLNKILEIYFNVENKTLYIESEEGEKFGEIINDLYNKYGWLKKRNIVGYELNGKKLDKNLTAQQNNISNMAKIEIIIG